MMFDRRTESDSKLHLTNEDALERERVVWLFKGRQMQADRRLLGKSIEDIAERYGITVTQASKMERGEICPVW